MAVRAVLGQQISTIAARAHAARLVALCGEPLSDPEGGLTHLFPAPSALAEAEPALPAGRNRTLRLLLTALGSGELDLSPGTDRERSLAVVGALPGIGPWTRDIIAMRALGDPDAFPAGDLGVRRGAEALALPTARPALLERAERWRPWRAYAVQHLWAATPHPINQWPPSEPAARAPAAERVAAAA
jgi:AraC family transcriptional regulator of adaptative response / DNA-3-methyladenine glycosylase II